MAKTNWPVGTVVVATCAIIDYDGDERPRIVAKPGDFGIVIEHCGSDTTHEVEFPGGLFTSAPSDAAVKLFIGAVSTVCDGQSTHPEQAALYQKMLAR
jgi:hypothetical protein